MELLKGNESPKDPICRFLWKIAKTENGCWLWQGCLTRIGYGQFRFGGRLSSPHRFIWQLINGPIPADKEIDHLCRVRSCANPDHLRLVTHKENMQHLKKSVSERNIVSRDVRKAIAPRDLREIYDRLHPRA